MKARTKAGSKVPTFSTYVTTEVDVDIDVDPGELQDAGWHHETECKHGPDPEMQPLGHVVASLHRQAHPTAPSIALCHEEPCRWLTLDQLQQVPE